jgi:hypothetical protein
MSEVALARLWQLADGTSCMLLKDPRADSWQLRVVRGTDTLRAEQFSGPTVAMDAAKRWRASYGHGAAGPPDSPPPT